MLTVCLTAHSGKAVAFHYSLETFSLRSTDDIHIGRVSEDISYSEDIA